MFYATTSRWLVVFIMCFACVESNDPECSNFTISGCSCTFLGDILGISCNNVSDISSLPNSLHSVFGIDDIYEITLEHFPAIPPGAIEGLNVSHFILDGTETAAVSQNAFDGVNTLQWFHVHLSSLTHMPNFRNVAHSLRKVNFDNSLLTKVEDEFQNLPLLTRLSLINNRLAYIQEDAFSGTTGIQFLDLSYNKFVSLPQRLFDEFTELIRLDLSHSGLHTVHGLFQNLGSKLKFLFLGFNHLSDADDILPPKLPMLKSLFLDNNPLRKLSVNTFNDTVPQLRVLSLRHCNLTDFRAKYFKNLSGLTLLILSFNQIKHIDSEYMLFGKSFDLLLDGNRIERFDGGITHRTRRLFVADNNLQHLGDMITETRLKEVDVSRNFLTSLEKNDFAETRTLEIIHFSNNQIERIDSRCFASSANSLRSLDLSCNRLTTLNGSLQFLNVLRTLNISNNFLENIDYEELKGLNELSWLYLQDNRILSLSGKVQNLPNLQYLILKNNEISLLSMEQIPRTLQYLDIKGNSLECNCQLYTQFLKSMKKGFPELDTTPCSQTNASKDLSQHPCPSPCSCYCEGEVTPSAVRANCSSRYLTSVPSDLNEGKPSASATEKLYRIDDTNFVIYDKIVSVDLSQNSIRSLEGVYFFRNLKKLYLSNNRLTTLPYDIMNLPKLKDMTLSGNKWLCDCDDGKAVEFRNWLLPEDRRVPDINKTICYNLGQNKVIISVSEAEICPGNVGLYLIIGLVLLGLFVLFLVLTIVYTRYKSHIKKWIFSKGVVRRQQKDVECDKTLDAFISFSNADRDFVSGEFVPGFKERCPCTNIFSEGIYLYEDLMKERKLHSTSFSDNKVTVIIVTRNFLEDQSCSNVMHVHKEEHDEFHLMIVIKVGDLPSDWEHKVKTFVPHAMYLEWGDKHFWHNFINSVPQTLGTTPENGRNNPLLMTTEL